MKTLKTLLITTTCVAFISTAMAFGRGQGQGYGNRHEIMDKIRTSKIVVLAKLAKMGEMETFAKVRKDGLDSLLKAKNIKKADYKSKLLNEVKLITDSFVKEGELGSKQADRLIKRIEERIDSGQLLGKNKNGRKGRGEGRGEGRRGRGRNNRNNN